jgi:hypothetical protein
MTEIDCPRARTPMTPCIARDGATALADPLRSDPRQAPSCVGCNAKPRDLLVDLAEQYEPARHHLQTHSPKHAADLLARFVAEYVS